MNKLTRLEKYHMDKVTQRGTAKVVSVIPCAVKIENMAIEQERRGHYRVAARLWLLCMDAASGEIERSRIAVRRGKCIERSNGLRSGDYSGICCRGVVYD
ncbi:PerC family transcriptional regulator [Kluyvera ascorbata]|uniref:PerC family transcriptional regulator n=1 Tax=Kluyvera ascorbata TaxID=51288 RepID=A0A3N2SDN7_9ENTR|nr:PerC family transcriptional regulator [Kluyvera ascorbata]ROU17822.1 PerC family transcriptional regulator [Kluyvera ascorbata]